MQKCHPAQPLHANSASSFLPSAGIDTSGESCRLKLQLQSMNALLDILTTVSRLGASVVSVDARGNEVDLTAAGREYVIRRLPSLLDGLVMVTEVREATAALDFEAVPLG